MGTFEWRARRAAALGGTCEEIMDQLDARESKSIDIISRTPSRQNSSASSSRMRNYCAFDDAGTRSSRPCRRWLPPMHVPEIVIKVAVLAGLKMLRAHSGPSETC
jgi:hypothetical protein